MSWTVGTEFEERLRRGDPEALAAQRGRALEVERDANERRQAQQRHDLEAQQEASRAWAVTRDELRAKRDAIRAELNLARGQMRNTGDDLAAAMRAAERVPGLELLEQQADADLRSHVSRMPAVGQLR